MEILVQSLLEKTSELHPWIYIRYWENGRQSVGSSRNEEDIVGPIQQGGTGRGMSYVIVRRSHSYLETVVNRVLDGAEDVRVLVDRRWRERRQAAHQVAMERRALPDRRTSAPMLDILIALGD